MTDLPDNTSRQCLVDNNLDNKQEQDGCPWYINSPKHNNCLWMYIYDKSGPDGSMQELVQSELAQLFGWSNTKTHFMLKQAMTEVIEAFKRKRGNQLTSSEPEQQLDVASFDIDPLSNYTSDDTED